MAGTRNTGKATSGARRARFYEPDSYEPGESVGYLVKRVQGSILRAIDARMDTHGLTDAQWGPLFLIQTGRGRTAAELARETCTDAGAMTRTLDRLEAKGLLRRVRSPQDRRVVHLELTPAGKRVVAHVPRVLSDVLNDHLAGVSQADFAVLKATLKQMLANGERLRAPLAAAA
jgi:DNA-binding MarR family transcriptional regulator